MSYYLIDFTKKEQKFDLKNLIIGKKISCKNNSKYYIYYNNDNNISELYVRLPKIRTIYNLANYKFNSLNLPIYPEFEITNNFIIFIKNLENYIDNYFKKKNKEFISLITKKKSLQFIRININDNFKITSNNNKDISLNNFKINSQLDIVIKLSYIWTNEMKIGLSSQIYQIKYYAPPDELDINFIDLDTENIIKPVIKYINESIINPTEIIQQNIISRPSLLEINNALMSLKKIK